MIKPMFPDAPSSGAPIERQGISQAEDSDRMRRIQRIIEELSPGKMRAQPKQDDISFESQADSKQAEPPASAESKDEIEPEQAAPVQPAQAQRKADTGKKSKAPAASLKKAAIAQSKKTAAAEEKAAPVKKLPRKPEQEELPAEAAEELPNAKKIVPKSIAREEPEEETQTPVPAKLKPRMIAREEPEEETQTPVPAKLKPRMVAREEQDEELPAAAAPAPAKLKPRMVAREEPEEETQTPVPAKLKPRMIAREEQDEELPAAAAPAPAKQFRKLVPRLPPSGNEEEEEPQPAMVSSMKRRILPGMGRTSPATQQTYVPPARERRQIALPPDETGEREMQDAPSEQAEAEAAPSRIAPLKPRKLASDEAISAVEKTPEQLLQDQKMAKMAEQLARLEAGRIKEVAGTAAMPAEEEDVPLPGNDDEVPKPEEYGQAKESLRKVLEHEETARKVKQEDEAMVEQYAKDHMVWLYEIYKMGGMGWDDFLQKASEKYSAAQGAAPSGGADKDAPTNPALAALSKEIEKKDKK